MGKRGARERFGGDTGWDLGAGVRLNIGDALTMAGPGKGAAIVPWALGRYGRAMRLRPGEMWLLKYMLEHAWEFGQAVYLSMRKTELTIVVDRSTLWRYLRQLERLNYIVCTSGGEGRDRRKRYDVRNAYAALAICIAYDESSRWATNAGQALTREKARGLTGLNGGAFDLDLDAIDALNERAIGMTAKYREATDEYALPMADVA